MAPLIEAVAVDHVGIAAPGASSPLAEALGAESPTGIAMPSGVTVARFGPARGLELVWPGRPGTPIDSFLARRGPGLHHVALRVDVDLAELRGRMEQAGLALVGSGIERSSDGRPCLFLHPRGTGGVLVELVQGASPGG
jgi:methylmalonyl-CoA/ethylmalonyl-CoA epimerase